MEVTSTSNQGPIQPRRPSAEGRIDLTRINRDGIQDATEDISEIRAPPMANPFRPHASISRAA